MNASAAAEQPNFQTAAQVVGCPTRDEHGICVHGGCRPAQTSSNCVLDDCHPGALAWTWAMEICAGLQARCLHAAGDVSTRWLDRKLEGQSF